MLHALACTTHGTTSDHGPDHFPHGRTWSHPGPVAQVNMSAPLVQPYRDVAKYAKGVLTSDYDS